MKDIKDRKSFLMKELLRFREFKVSDLSWLENLSLAELEKLHIKVKCEHGRLIKREMIN
ncbi:MULTISPECIES: hypothetical protein [Bacillus]|uniref:hypothetical protein n=1 Tax=Bacillus TaxID=1386 RepID=UPI0015F805A7|nr:MULTISPECIES: hypothetical protein [Bacillus]MCY8636531.1 Fur-regulated basic protein FbpA [Bacillus sp. S17B2]MBT3123297.1 Fur-regulated basic protein FbpA [Bacillus inaquosorum]MCB4338879.1 hypothetical protein [Bacillus subtilis]MCB5337236.1 hypothetical protein [Bacillus amyloliquefaciens]MCF7615555.1 Fur-regulated basic protein FbpA [Bacillus subtilis]